MSAKAVFAKTQGCCENCERCNIAKAELANIGYLKNLHDISVITILSYKLPRKAKKAFLANKARCRELQGD